MFKIQKQRLPESCEFVSKKICSNSVIDFNAYFVTKIDILTI